MAPSPIRPLAWLLRRVSSRDAANAAIGDVLEELGERRAGGWAPRRPALWVNLQTVRAIVAELLGGAPRWLRSAALIVRDAARAIRAAPAHSLFVVFVLAAGVTLGTVTFSVVDAVVLKPLPVDHPEQLVNISVEDKAFKPRITPDVYWRLHEELPSVDSMAMRGTGIGLMVTVDGAMDEMAVTRATADIFRVLRLSPAIGRFWTADDEAHGRRELAVLGYRFWHERLGGDPSVLGKTITEGKRSYTVIGVLSAASDHPEVPYLTNTPVWVPMILPHTPDTGWYGGILARMRPGVSTAQVADDVQRIVGAPDWRPEVTPLLDQ